MLTGLKQYFDYQVHASDGNIGVVRDAYFDDRNWIIRYLSVELTELDEPHQVLVAPLTIRETDHEKQALWLNLSSERILNSPRLEDPRIITREQEEQLHNYYDWPVYWTTTTGFGLGVGDLSAIPLIDLATDRREKMSEDLRTAGESTEPVEQQLRSVNATLQYHALSRENDDIGIVTDFLVDERTWQVIYFIVNTTGWSNENQIVLSPAWVERVSWAQALFYLDLTRDLIEKSPRFDPGKQLQRDDEDQLFEHYQRSKYWKDS